MAMDLQTRKLNVIEFLIGLDDETAFNKIEAAIYRSKKNKNPIHVFTKQELKARAEKSKNDYLNGRITTQAELEAEAENW